MNITFLNGSLAQTTKASDGLDDLRQHYPINDVQATVRVSFVADPAASFHNEAAVTIANLDGTFDIRIASEVGARDELRGYLAHEIGHVMIALIGIDEGIAREIFKAPASAHFHASDTGGEWKKALEEATAETFKDVFLDNPPYTNLTDWKLPSENLYDFKRLFLNVILPGQGFPGIDEDISDLITFTDYNYPAPSAYPTAPLTFARVALIDTKALVDRWGSHPTGAYCVFAAELPGATGTNPRGTGVLHSGGTMLYDDNDFDPVFVIPPEDYVYPTDKNGDLIPMQGLYGIAGWPFWKPGGAHYNGGGDIDPILFYENAPTHAGDEFERFFNGPVGGGSLSTTLTPLEVIYGYETDDTVPPRTGPAPAQCRGFGEVKVVGSVSFDELVNGPSYAEVYQDKSDYARAIRDAYVITARLVVNPVLAAPYRLGSLEPRVFAEELPTLGLAAGGYRRVGRRS